MVALIGNRETDTMENLGVEDNHHERLCDEGGDIHVEDITEFRFEFHVGKRRGLLSIQIRRLKL